MKLKFFFNFKTTEFYKLTENKLRSMLKKNEVFIIYSIKVFLLLSLCFYTTAFARDLNPSDSFTYNELETLYEKETLSETLKLKLNRLLTTPFVENSYKNSTSLRLSKSPQLGEFLRIVQWNIERGLEYEAIEAAFSDKVKFGELLNKEKFPAGSAAARKIMQQAEILRSADVIVLNEVDWGLKRTNYRNIVADLASRLKMNYAFGVQFVELSPVQLSREPIRLDETENEVLNIIKVDPARYKGLHGIAILSRFPLENVRLIPFNYQPYDWYESEKKDVSLLEKGKRTLSKKVFLEKTLKEVRRGGRTTLLADIADAGFPSGRVTIAATHLENRTKPAGQVEQLKELLDTVKDIRHPVVIAGDMNTSTEDLTPTSFRREFMKRFGSPEFWIREGLGYALGIGFIENFLMAGVTVGRKHADPTVRHIPFFSPNPSEKFFKTLKSFRFTDGGAFDFRGSTSRSFGGSHQTFANSNERGKKGFITTYRVNRPIKIIGKYKLDWIFVKPAGLTQPEDKGQSYRFAPHFGRTLTEINQAVEERISDHRPILVDLPLKEPLLKDEEKVRI